MYTYLYLQGIVNEKQQEIDKLKLEIATQTREMVRLKEERNGLQRDHTNNEEELKSFKSENLNLKTQTKQDRKTISDQKVENSIYNVSYDCL